MNAEKVRELNDAFRATMDAREFSDGLRRQDHFCLSGSQA
jgi:hypothetical protein